MDLYSKYNSENITYVARESPKTLLLLWYFKKNLSSCLHEDVTIKPEFQVSVAAYNY
jgi:hypothetical protein